MTSLWKKRKFPNIGSLGGLYSKVSSLEDDFCVSSLGGLFPERYGVIQSLFWRNFQRCDLTLVYSVYPHKKIAVDQCASEDFFSGYCKLL